MLNESKHSLYAVGIVIPLTIASHVVSASDEQQWQISNAGTSLNSEYHEGWATMTLDGLTVYFASNRPGGAAQTDLEDHWALAKAGGLTAYDMYVAHRDSTDAPWGQPILLPDTVNSPAADHSAYLSDDGRHLFFASAREGGCGDLDLYVSVRDDINDDQAWQSAKNLGCASEGGPNGPAIDSCPILLNDQIYFTSSTTPDPMTLDFKRAAFDASNLKGEAAEIMSMSTAAMDAHFDPRHGLIWGGYPEGGQGGSDLWVFANYETESDPANWANPINLGAAVNTEFEEHMPSATSDGNLMLFVSDRPGGQGGLDIFQAVKTAH